MTAHQLAFFVIGAQKAGTTTLFQHLAEHPDLFIPAAKEAPFFSHPERRAKGLDWYVDEYFRGASPSQRWGTVTPQYLYRTGTAAHLHDAVPDARLVAILREPVARTISHHRMAVARGQEARSLAEVVDALLEPDAVEAARTTVDESQAYVAWSEYGRQLDEYLAVFEAEQLLVVFTEDLERDPGAVVTAVHRHLGVDPIPPSSLGAHFHVEGGGGARAVAQRLLRRAPALRRAWHRVPVRHREAVAGRLGGFSRAGGDRSRSAADDGLDAPRLERLRAHLRRDVVRVREIAGDVPWPEWET